MITTPPPQISLTRPQRLTLAFLETHPHTSWTNPAIRHRVGMLRVMEERGWVSRNSHGHWSIAKAGQSLLIDFYNSAGRSLMEQKG